MTTATEIKHHMCMGCGSILPERDLEEIVHLERLVDVGELVPSGICPRCGKLCHPVEPERMAKRVHTVAETALQYLGDATAKDDDKIKVVRFALRQIRDIIAKDEG
jgi:hypothetical protein